MNQRFLFLAGLLTHFPQLQTLCLVLPYPPTGHSIGTDTERAKHEKYRARLESELVEFWYRHGINCGYGVQGLGRIRDEIETFSFSACRRFLTEGPRWEMALRFRWASDVDCEIKRGWDGEGRELSRWAQHSLSLCEENGWKSDLCKDVLDQKERSS